MAAVPVDPAQQQVAAAPVASDVYASAQQQSVGRQKRIRLPEFDLQLGPDQCWRAAPFWCLQCSSPFAHTSFMTSQDKFLCTRCSRLIEEGRVQPRPEVRDEQQLQERT